ncbi:U11/U12 small nuclear ribonucleoprotein, partial [Thalictrum thalictroides]
MPPPPPQFSPAAPPPPWYMIVQPTPAMSSSFWTTGNVHNRLQDLRETLDLAKSMKKELEVLNMSKETCNEEVNDDGDCDSVRLFTKVLEEKKINMEMQELQSVEAVNSLIAKMNSQIEPFNVLMSQNCSWEEKYAVARLTSKIQKYKRNKSWRKRKRKRIAEMLVKERERFELADQEADEWRAREIAKDIARRKVEKMKEIAKLKANEERSRLESELELVLIVEKLQELRSIRIQKLKKQGHFLPEEDDKFLERVRAAVEEEERQAAAASVTDAAKDAIAAAEESRKTVQSNLPDAKDSSSINENGGTVSQGRVTDTENEKVFSEGAELKSEQQGLDAQSSSGPYNSVASLPVEFYHYYHGSNTDMGTLIEVRRTWDAYIRPGGSRIPGHWVQPPPPANKIWASYLVYIVMMRLNVAILSILFLAFIVVGEANRPHDEQPLSKIAIHKTTLAIHESAYVKASPSILGLKGLNSEWVTVTFSSPSPSIDDWIGVFSPANFSAATCSPENKRVSPPLLCSAPIKYQFTNFSSPKYKDTGKGYLKLQLINQREDFSFALFSGGLTSPKLIAVSNTVAFVNPKAPVYPRLAQGKIWNEMTVTWTSGYGINEAEPFVEWGLQGGDQIRSPAGTLTFSRSSMCGAPARTVGWRDPGFIHTSFLKELWPNSMYTYKLGHKLFNGTYVWSQSYHFKASPYPGQDSKQQVVIFGDMGK